MSRYLSLFFLICLLITAAIVIVRFSDGSTDTLNTGGFMLELGGTIEHGVNSSATAIEDFWRGYFFLVNTKEENNALRNTVDTLKGSITRLREAQIANQRLTRLLNFKESSPLPIKGFRVIALDPEEWFKTIVISGGRSDGLKPGMPVATAAGVVGRIIETSPHYSKVLLMLDYNSSVDALIQRTRVRGVLSGRSRQTCRLKYLLKSEDVVQGDILVTSGFAGVFPKGLKLGTVSRVRKIQHDLFLEIEVNPAVNFNKLEEVLVILRKDNRF